jgi:cell division transport system ATP-binding protein
MIKFTHVYKTYPGPTHALQDINVSIEKGEFVFLVGPSGAGKTTLFRMMSAFDKPTSGEVGVMGYSINALSVADVPIFRRRIGVVFQDFRLLKGRSIFENVALPLIIQSERPTAIAKRVDEILDQVGLKYKFDQLVDQLSGGEQQRVAIARALIHKPGLLIADEPTGNLDPDMSSEIMNLFQKANAQGTTVVIATHDIQTVNKMQKRVLRLKSGQVVESEVGRVTTNTML